jgi:hypothetical protein
MDAKLSKAEQQALKEKKARINACEQAVMAALKKYKCRMVTQQVFIDGQAQPIQVLIAALE